MKTFRSSWIHKTGRKDCVVKKEEAGEKQKKSSWYRSGLLGREEELGRHLLNDEEKGGVLN